MPSWTTRAAEPDLPRSAWAEIDLDALRGMLDERTRMVAVVHVSNTLGTINPVEQIVQMEIGRASCREKV